MFCGGVHALTQGGRAQIVYNLVFMRFTSHDSSRYSGEPRDLVEIVLQVHGVLRGFAAGSVLVVVFEVFLCLLCADDEEVDDGRHDAQSHADLQDEPAMCEAGIRMDRAAGAP